MDNLEKELLDSLESEFIKEFETVESMKRFIVSINNPLDSIDQDNGVNWVQRVPPSVREHWEHLPASSRFLVSMLASEIQSLNVLLDDCENVRQRLSGRKNPGSPSR